MRTRVTELFGIRYPIVQGGLAHLAFAGLCAAVSNAGGLGQISAATIPGGPEALRAEIAEVRRRTSNPFAVNFAISVHRDTMSLVEIAIEEGVQIMSFTAGNPEPFLRRLEGTGIKTLVLVAAVRQAEKVESLGGDAVVVVGHEGGGHLGRDDIGTLVLVPRVVDSVGIPVLASGGIGDGRGLAAALALGAEGVEMGTRFVATQECIAHDTYKQALVDATETTTTIIERSLRTPGRALAGQAADRVLALEEDPADRERLLAAIKGEVNKRGAIEGHLDEGWVWSGQVAGLIHDVPTVQELLDRMVAEGRERAGASAEVFCL